MFPDSELADSALNNNVNINDDECKGESFAASLLNLTNPQFSS